ncbi:MAG: proton-conducting transporter membrane subunit [Sulfurimonas sp.]|jgi:ech hydrogenase subunit A|nr:proton-conducting transporter membrane subunit [Sulfurimonas sp.]
MALQLSIIFLPFLMGISLFFPSFAWKKVLIITYILVLMLLSILLFFITSQHFSYSFSSSWHSLFILVDFGLLAYFFYVGMQKKQLLVVALALLQVLLFSFVLSLEKLFMGADILLDRTILFMYLLINIVGGTIIIFALKYIESETFSQRKKDAFIASLFLFLGVMNFIVSVNNIELFFLLFEATTLLSYLLIRYRGDTLSITNALRALWMNQIGGVAILLGLICSLLVYKTLSFDILLAQSGTFFMFALIFLALAAFVKAASLPFEKWLLGAMVAPTPVSAILHSATMVKIAPFLMLKLSSAMDDFLSLVFVLLGTFVFFAASLLALSKDYFKEILGLSTIALLALMMALASLGTPHAIEAVLFLMLFHAISKALLFMQAGILEKTLALKYVQDIDGLINYSPKLVFFILLGFASLTLPPFGAFIGKFMAIESIAAMIKLQPLYAFALIFTALGSIFLTLLYFKVVTKLFALDVDAKKEKVQLSKYYTIPSWFLVFLLFVGMVFALVLGALSPLEIFLPLVILVLIPLSFFLFIFPKAQRVKEYHCGEKEDVELGMYSFDIKERYTYYFYALVFLGFALAFLGVLL